MSNTAYIESGILECYALGICSGSEKLEVEKLCADHTVLKAELQTIQHTLFTFGELHKVQPKPSVKNNIMAQIDAENLKINKAPIISLQPKKYSFAMAASVALFGISLLANILIYSKYQSANDQVLVMNAKNSQMADNMKSNTVKLEAMNQDLAFISNEKTARISLKGMDKSPKSLVMIYWNKQTKEVMMEVKSLPPPAQGMQYQLWAIVDGKPVDAGMIANTNLDANRLKMNSFDSAQAFAITLEKEGGSVVPTLTEIYVMGQVGA